MRDRVDAGHRYGNVFLHVLRRNKAQSIKMTPEEADKLADDLRDAVARIRKTRKPVLRIAR